MKFAELPEVSDRTRRAVQDYTALNTIITALERFESAGHDVDATDPLTVAIVSAFANSKEEDVDRVRLRLNCPLGHRASALGLLRSGRSTRAGVIR